MGCGWWNSSGRRFASRTERSGVRSPLILGSRGSKLALWQANFIKSTLERQRPIEVRIETIRTTGDKITDVPLATVGGTKALFTKEIEEALLAGARVGTSSLRRQVQLRRLRKDLVIEPLRGNLDTRLRKLDEGQYDAVVVAQAGLKRMGWADRATQVFSVEEMLPAIGQGALAIEARADDKELLAGLDCLRDPDTEAATQAERAFLRRLG